jgi:RNA polymerase sigma-70 factor (ECF subfamily)
MSAGSEWLEVWRLGHEEWPELDVPAERFTAFVESKGASGETERTHAGDLYLACACLEGVPTALKSFERKFGEDLARALRRGDSSGEDLYQLVLERLFTRGPSGPKIAQYSGRAALRHWLRVVAVRTAQNERRKRVDAPSNDDAIFSSVVADADSPESKLISASLMQAYKAAFEEAFRELDPSERTILRFSVINEMSIDEIARLLKVHRATAARRVAAARARLGELTKARVMNRAGLTPKDFDSAVQLIRSNLELSLRRVFSASSSSSSSSGDAK